MYTSGEVRKLSVKRITNPVLLDQMNHPTVGGLYDPALGPQKQGEMYVVIVAYHFLYKVDSVVTFPCRLLPSILYSRP